MLILPTGTNDLTAVYNLLTLAGFTMSILFVLLVIKYFAQQVTKIRTIIR